VNPTGVLMIVLGVFVAGRLLFKDSNGETLAGRLAGGQPTSLTGGNATGSVNAEGTVTAATSKTPTTSSLPIITSKGGGALNANQLTFANTLAKLTGLNIATVKGWVIGEEPASSAQAPNGANNWLNIGSTDSGFYGGGDSVWSNPVTAAQVTAAWLKGLPAVPGYGTASSGIQSILSSAKGSIASQVAAIQNSGWASGGYPNLPSFVSSFL
jgi:hypothetical protein